MIYFPATPSASTSISSTPTSSSYAAITSHAPTRSSTSLSHHLFTTRIPGICTVLSQISISCRIAMYRAAVFCLLSTHASKYSNPASCIAISKGGYYQLTSRNHRGFLAVIHMANLCWNPSIACPVWGVIIHIYDPKINTAYTTALKNTPDTLGFPPLPSQEYQQLCSSLPLIMQVTHQLRPIIIRCFHDMTQVLQWRYRV